MQEKISEPVQKKSKFSHVHSTRIMIVGAEFFFVFIHSSSYLFLSPQGINLCEFLGLFWFNETYLSFVLHACDL